MEKLLAHCGIIGFLALLVGCAATAPGLGQEAGNTSLPPGLTLLDSFEGDCDGTVQVEDEPLGGGGSGLEAEFFVEAGENATFELNEGYDEIEWACVGGGSSDVESARCPSGTTHVRITRASTGGELLFECFGQG